MKAYLNIVFSLVLIVNSTILIAQDWDSVYFGKQVEIVKNHLKSNLDSAIYYTDKMLVESQISKNNKVKGQANNLKGLCFIYLGKYDSAIFRLNRSLSFYKNLNTKAACDAYSNIGICYDYLGNYSEAIKNYLKSVSIAELIKDSVAIARASNNLGTVYFQQKNYQKALEYFNGSLAIRENQKDDYGIASCCLNIASCYDALKQSKQSLDMYNRALKYALLASDSVLLADIYLSLGQLLSEDHKYEEAIKEYENVLSIYRKFNDPRMLCEIYWRMGDIYGKLKMYRKAHQYLLMSNSNGRAANYLSGIKSACERLVVTSAALGFVDSTGYYLQQVKNMQDTLYSESTTKEIAAMQEKYESDKKDAEIVIKNSQIEKQNIEAEKRYLQRNILIVALGLSVLLAIFFYQNYRNKSRANDEIRKQKEVISYQNQVLEVKQKEIIDSINYAKRIQYTLLAHKEFLKVNLPEHFTFFHPKDIVSGDFYWATKKDEKFYLAVCDSTGHGVPGAFMSLLNIGFLNEAINEKGIEKPNEVFDYVRIKLTETISKEGQKDGFDGILVCFDKRDKSISYSAANNSPILVRDHQLVVLPYDRMPVGIGEKKEKFNLYNIEAEHGDMLYLYTDGFADQFGGPRGKKFMYRQLNELLITNRDKPLQEQQVLLKSAFENWKGHLEQVDDVCVIGIKI